MEPMNEEKVILLDGAKVTLAQLREKQCDPNVRVVQITENEYKTLARMHG